MHTSSRTLPAQCVVNMFHHRRDQGQVCIYFRGHVPAFVLLAKGSGFLGAWCEVSLLLYCSCAVNEHINCLIDHVC